MRERGASPFRLIDGGGQGQGHQRRADLIEVEAASSGAQLVLPGMSGKRPVLLSVGFDGITFTHSSELIRTAKVRRVVDIRKLAAFGSRDFRPWLIDRLFEQHDVNYQRMFDLGNSFLGTTSNRLLVMRRYGQYIQEHLELVRALRRQLDDESPLLLLGRQREHAGSERAILVAALVQLECKFDLAVVQADGSMHVVDPIQ